MAFNPEALTNLIGQTAQQRSQTLDTQAIENDKLRTADLMQQLQDQESRRSAQTKFGFDTDLATQSNTALMDRLVEQLAADEIKAARSDRTTRIGAGLQHGIVVPEHSPGVGDQVRNRAGVQDFKTGALANESLAKTGSFAAPARPPTIGSPFSTVPGGPIVPGSRGLVTDPGLSSTGAATVDRNRPRVQGIPLATGAAAAGNTANVAKTGAGTETTGVNINPDGTFTKFVKKTDDSLQSTLKGQQAQGVARATTNQVAGNLLDSFRTPETVAIARKDGLKDVANVEVLGKGEQAGTTRIRVSDSVGQKRTYRVPNSSLPQQNAPSQPQQQGTPSVRNITPAQGSTGRDVRYSVFNPPPQNVFNTAQGGTPPTAPPTPTATGSSITPFSLVDKFFNMTGALPGQGAGKEFSPFTPEGRQKIREIAERYGFGRVTAPTAPTIQSGSPITIGPLPDTSQPGQSLLDRIFNTNDAARRHAQ